MELTEESSGTYSSLCTTLGAAESFSPSHLSKPEIASLIDRAQNFYLGGFFLTHGLESALILAKHAAEKNKVSAAVLLGNLRGLRCVLSQFEIPELPGVRPH